MSLGICFVGAECAPFVRTGALADVSAALPAALRDLGHDVRIVMPLYGSIDRDRIGARPVELVRDARLRLGPLTFSAWAARLPGTKVAVYLVDVPSLFDRDEIYGTDPDEGLRFAALARAAIEFCRHMGWGPDVFHLNDWHAGLLPLYLKARYRDKPLFERTRTVLTIHDVRHQGPFGVNLLPALGLSGHADLFDGEDLEAGAVNFLKTAILHADALTAPSRHGAWEMRTPELGSGLDRQLSQRAEKLSGILNGIDTDEWDPASDGWLPSRYSAADPAGKAVNREALLTELGLAADPAGPLFGMVAPLGEDQGIALLLEALPGLLSTRDCRVALQGAGEARFEEALSALQADFPDRAAYRATASDELGHLIVAGADVLLVPSLHEPGVTRQLVGQRYGTPPIARRTGALADTVATFDEATGEGTGFLFDEPTAAGLRGAVDRALEVWEDRGAWRRLVAKAMATDPSWRRTARSYEALYRSLA